MLLLFIAPQPAPANPGYINAALAVGDLWAPLNARGPSDAIFWTESELYNWIDEAVQRFARKHGSFVVYDTSLTSVAGDADYALPASHIRTYQADLNNNILRARNAQEAQALDSGWTTAADDEPRAFLLDTAGLNQLTLQPPPSVTFGALSIGLVMAQLPATVTAATAILAAPPVLRDYFTFYALAEARRKESNASMDEVSKWLLSIVDLIDQAAAAVWD